MTINMCADVLTDLAAERILYRSLRSDPISHENALQENIIYLQFARRACGNSIQRLV